MTQQSVFRHEAQHLSRLNAIRCKRGRALFRARHGNIVRIGEYDYRVPSQHDGGLYNVRLGPDAADCTCPDFGRHGRRCEPGEFHCKHLFAALLLKVKSARTAPPTQSAQRAQAS